MQELVLTNNYDIFLEMFPALKKLETTPQDKYYHAEGDVWTHTKMVLDSLRTNNLIKPFTEYSLDKQFIMFIIICVITLYSR